MYLFFKHNIKNTLIYICIHNNYSSKVNSTLQMKCFFFFRNIYLKLA